MRGAAPLGPRRPELARPRARWPQRTTVRRQRLSWQRARQGIVGTGSGEHAEVVVVLAWVLGVEERRRPGSSAPIDGHGGGSEAFQRFAG